VRTILIVDDELAIAEVLSHILEDEGYSVTCAPNGLRGLDRISQSKPDLVILDYMMPIMGGAEMGKVLRANPDTRSIPILFNSSLDEAVVREQFSEYDAYLRKPFNVDRALELIKSLLASNA
jgi:CheY-like chemotaxis protein